MLWKTLTYKGENSYTDRVVLDSQNKCTEARVI